MGKFQLIILIILIPVAGIFIFQYYTGTSIREVVIPGDPVMHIGDIPIRVEVVSTPEERAQGLSGREGFGGVEGMLFVFDRPDYHGIWMKDMQFPIDVIWISESLKVIAISKRLTPESFPRIYEPPSPALYAVETDIGFSETFNITVGDKVELPYDFE